MSHEVSIPSAAITEHWNIALEDPIESIPALTNLVFRADGFLIRVERRAIESVAWEHELLAFLAAEVREVVAPIRAVDGTTFLARSGEVISIFPYLEGEHMSHTDETVRRRLPNVLARIHRRALAWPTRPNRPGQPSFCELDWERNLWWDWSLIEPTPVLKRAFSQVRGWVETRPALTVCAIHGDIHPGNVLTRDGEIVGVLDWSFSRLDWPAFDLACAVGVLALNQDGSFDRDISQQVLADYTAAGGPGEANALEPLLRLFFLGVSLFSLTLTARGEGQYPKMVAMMEQALTQLG